MAIAESGKGTSKVLVFLKSLLFVQHVFEVNDLAVITKSRKIRSAALTCQKKVRSRLVRDPLTVQVVSHFEEVVCADGVDEQRCLMSGLVLACIYSRSRWTELQHAVAVIEDQVDSDKGFVKFILDKVKTLKAELRGRARLSVVAPAVGVTGLTWAKAWLALRDLVFPGRVDCSPLLPVPLSDGGWGSRPISSTEATAWIRSLASEVLDHDKVSRLSSYSCKATTLSWVCKYGVSESLRAMLGYHKAGQHRMVDCYGRDHQAPALRALCQVLSSVRECSLKPDETRSGRFVDEPSAASNVGQSSGSVTEVVASVAGSSSESSWPSGDETGSGASTDSGERKDDLAEGSLVKHRKHGTLNTI